MTKPALPYPPEELEQLLVPLNECADALLRELESAWNPMSALYLALYIATTATLLFRNAAAKPTDLDYQVEEGKRAVEIVDRWKEEELSPLDCLYRLLSGAMALQLGAMEDARQRGLL